MGGHRCRQALNPTCLHSAANRVLRLRLVWSIPFVGVAPRSCSLWELAAGLRVHSGSALVLAAVGGSRVVPTVACKLADLECKSDTAIVTANVRALWRTGPCCWIGPTQNLRGGGFAAWQFPLPGRQWGIISILSSFLPFFPSACEGFFVKKQPLYIALWLLFHFLKGLSLRIEQL